ncbi:MAG: DUF4430 domain-containing protein [Actinobacteria bacterium]|nr:MAG: DUF4430 domain-containing protein [Actinomycetota bacterium]
MSRRLLIFLAVSAAALLLVPAALALRVHVRVEGKTQTIFGAAEPTLAVKANALDALESASLAGEFYYHVTVGGFGPYVDQIGRYPAGGSSGWVFKVNGLSPPVGADAVVLKPGDRVLWYWATFGPSGGPPTLVLRRASRGCYRVLAQDDAGKTRAARGAMLRVDGRSVRARAGSACVGAHRGLVRATLKGAVRSNALA